MSEHLRVLICGSRTFSNRKAMEIFIATLEPDTVVIHGNAPGADSYAKACARTAGLEVESYPALWEIFHFAAGPIRNQQMLDEGKPDIVYAFTDGPLDEKSGTYDMLTRARTHDIPCVVYEL